MERWVPLFEIFLNSPFPETEASLWLQQSFNPSLPAPISTCSFLALLSNPSDAILIDSSSHSSSSPPRTKRFMYIQTLPNVVQARILSFLVYERQRFCKNDLVKLARNMLTEGQELDFWVKKTAQQLLDVLSASDYEWVSYLNLDSEESKLEDDFRTVPDWLKDAAKNNDLVLPWLPISADEFNLKMPFSSPGEDGDSVNNIHEEKQEYVDEIVSEVDEVTHSKDVPISPEVERIADSLKYRILHFETTSRTVEAANEIHQLCVKRGADSLGVLTLIEPWKADDETSSILISNILGRNEDELDWPSHVICSNFLPKLLALNEPASRVLVSSIIDCCKIHQKAAEYALLVPLILKKEGINNPICDVITRIVRECLHPAHVSAFCQKIFCKEVDGQKFICLPCHRCLIASEIVWTESLFTLMQNILNHNIHLTMDTVDQLVHGVCKCTDMLSRSLKLGNFLLCLVNKCSPFLKPHKLLLIEAVEKTNTLVTRAVLSKLASL